METHDTLEGSLNTFLLGAGVPAGQPVALGHDAPKVTPAQRKQLMSDLAAAEKRLTPIIWLWIAVVFGVFILASGFAVYYRTRTELVTAFIFCSSGVLALILRQVKEVHTRQLSTQILLALLPNLPTQTWTKVALTFASEILKAPKR